jgi:Putative beta-barrel porin-2, OmpL-like. bbp2
MRLCASVLAIAVLSPLSAFAQEPPPAAPATPPADAPPAATTTGAPAAAPVAVTPVVTATPAKSWKDLAVIDGLVDAYYQAIFNGRNSTNGATAVRQFDTNTNTFTLAYAKLGIGVNADPVGLRMDIGYSAVGLGFTLVQQAYATLVPVDRLTIDFGKFVTSAGAEVIEANKNWNYSRSVLFFNIPLVHTGLRVGYQVNKDLSLQASVVNGWNGTGFNTDVDAGKTFGVSVNFMAPTGTNIVLTGYFGKESVTNNTDVGPVSGSTRVLVDLVVAHTIAALGLNLNIDYINDQNSGGLAPVYDNYFGIAGMAKYTLNEHLALAGRGEFAKNGGTSIEEGTVTLAVPFGGRFEFRAEVRGDFSNQPIFNGGPGIGGALPDKKNQFTGTGAFLAWF